MKENNREGSTVTTAITALIFFLILALFAKSVQATELLTQINVVKSITLTTSNSVVKTVDISSPRKTPNQVCRD